MARFRNEKNRLFELCLRSDWRTALEETLAQGDTAQAAVSPLMGLLSRPETRWQAAYGLGLAVPLLALSNMERARVVMRRLMWSLNEESGNLGWGIPEAMACITAASPALADEYARIFLSYGYETGKDDNFLDYSPLRRGVFWGMGRLAQGNPDKAAPALPHLVRALANDDIPLRGFAAWSLEQLALNAAQQPEADWSAAAEAASAALTDPENDTEIELFDGEAIVRLSVRTLLERARRACAGTLPRTPQGA